MAVSHTLVFRDRLGRRHELGDFELLVLNDELAAVPAFEATLRESVRQFTGFHHPNFAQVRWVHRLQGTTELCVASERVSGIRLSDVLAAVEQQRLALTPGVALSLIQQLVRALAALHEQLPNSCHGAISPERIVVTPEARILIVDHVYGAALEQLHLSHEQYWNEWRLPLPKTLDLPRFDQCADVMQVGAVALALLLGRLLDSTDGPDAFETLVESAWRRATESGTPPPPTAVRGWLAATLQLDPNHSLNSAPEALVALDAALGASYDESQLDSVKALVATLPEQQSAKPASPDNGAVSAAGPAPITPPSPSRPVTVSVERPETSQEPDVHSAPREAANEPIKEERSDDMPVRMPPTRHGWIAASVALVVLGGGGALLAGQWARTPSVAKVEFGTLMVSTMPPGAAVVLDGERQGTAPVTLNVPAGEHWLEVLGEGDARRIPVTIAAGSTTSQHLELAAIPSGLGDLQVRSEPSGARVTIDGNPAGETPLIVEGLTAGEHSVVLASELGSVTHMVSIEEGAMASLVVPMRVPEGVPVSGWISVEAAADVQVYENGSLLGTSQSDRIMVSAGRHELEIVNETLRYRIRRTVTVSPGQVAAVQLDWPTGSISINARPWAQVWIDGEGVGETPIGNLTLPIGRHEITFRHPELGERLVPATVAVGEPTRVSVDLSQR